MSTALGEGEETELEREVADMLLLRAIILCMPDLSTRRRKLIRKRLNIIREIRIARKNDIESEVERLLKQHDDLGNKIDEIDSIVEKGFELQSRI